MQKILAALVLALALGGVAGPLDARTMVETLRRTGLSQQDIDVMSKTAAGLYQTGTPRVGRTESWSNAETGAKGSVKLVAFRNNCAYLQHFIITTRRPTAQEFRFTQCRDAAGNWVLTP